MSTFKRIVAWVVVAVSVVLLLAQCGGIAGTWVARGLALQVVADLFDLADRVLTTGLSVSDRLDTRLVQARADVAKIDASIRTVSERAEDATPVRALISSTVGAELQPHVEDIRAMAETVRDFVQFADSTLTTINRLPSQRREENAIDRALSIIADVQEAVQGVRDFQTQVQDTKVQLVRSTVESVAAPLRRADAALGRMQTRNAEIKAHLQARQAGLPAKEAAIGNVITAVTVGVTIVMVWFALAMLALIFVALSVALRRDLFARLRS